MPLLLILAAGCLVSAMSMRLLDPVVPAIARELAVRPETAALLASAFTFPYALGQPVLGALGDALGKAKIIKISLAVAFVCVLASALAPNIATLFLARIAGGAAAGGIIPLAFALVGDRFAFAERQVALSRILMAVIAGQMLGALGSGFVAAHAGWRTSLLLGAGLTLAALVLTMLQLRPRPLAERPRFTLSGMKAGYAEVFANPRTAVCFTAVFVEGIVIFGLFPFIALLLEKRGAGGLKEAGFVLAGFGIGGFLYTLLVGLMLRRLGILHLIRSGGVISALGYVALAAGSTWPAEMAAFVLIGVGFYMIHNSLQTEATELAPGNRGAAVAAHAFFFFLGQAAGPVIFGASLAMAGPGPTLLGAGAAMAATGFATAFGLTVRGRRLSAEERDSHRPTGSAP